MTEQSLYERLGGVYAIAAVVDRFSDQLLKNPKIVNANPELKEWHTEKYKARLAGLKFNRTLWVCAVSGGPYEYTAKSLHDAHLDLHIPPEVFDEVSAELGLALDYFKVPKREKDEALAAFNAQKSDVTAGSMTKVGR
jgi:hemoglobin